MGSILKSQKTMVKSETNLLKPDDTDESNDNLVMAEI